MIEHTVGDGKYTITYDNGVLSASRYDNKTWRDLTGDGMVLAMLQEIDNLKKQLQVSKLERIACEILKDPDVFRCILKDGKWDFSDKNGHNMNLYHPIFNEFHKEFTNLCNLYGTDGVEIDIEKYT